MWLEVNFAELADQREKRIAAWVLLRVHVTFYLSDKGQLSKKGKCKHYFQPCKHYSVHRYSDSSLALTISSIFLARSEHH
jgi:hypothetical protein